MTVQLTLQLLAPILAALGAYVGVRTSLVKIETVQAEHGDRLDVLDRRTLRHGTVLTVVATKANVAVNDLEG